MLRVEKVDFAWLMLMLLTLGGGLVGNFAQPGFWITVAIAVMTLVKARLVVDYFMELEDASPLIRRVVGAFCAIIPLLMIITYVWSEKLVWFSGIIIGN